MDFISVASAEKLIFDTVPFAPIGAINIGNLREEVLAQKFVADRNYPPFDRVAMDGIAIAYQQWQEGQRQFKIHSLQKAGEGAKDLVESGLCIEVMTGAPMPRGADTVIRYEDIVVRNGVAEISNVLVEPRQNIHFEGADYLAGSELVHAGVSLRAPEWSVAASIGQSQVQVYRRPKIAVISTGDELVAVEETPHPHQIRLSNGYALKASLLSHGFSEVQIFHLKDEESEMFRGLKEVFLNFDWVLLSGGVSMGKFDFVPQILADLGVEKVFHKIAQKPGKPIWFGMSSNKQPVFGLPGNPVSALICLHRYVLPALQKSIGGTIRPLFAKLTEDVSFKKPLSYFLSIRIDVSSEGQILATPVKSNGSGDFSSLLASDGFVELRSDKDQFFRGEGVPLFLWRQLC